MRDLPPRTILYLRSTAFLIFWIVTTVLYATLSVFTFFLPFAARYRIITSWSDLNIWWLERTCKLTYRVDGLSNIPNQPSIVMSNHQSSWETMALKRFFPPMAWVVKRELLWVPFFGWGMALTEPSALDRGAGRAAVEQLLRRARERLQAGRWIIVFPEGTRVPPGHKKPFKMGGAVVASHYQVPVVPVAHNAGYFWPRRTFLKLPGTITLSIGPPINTAGKAPERVIEEARTWIQEKVQEISPDMA